MYHWKDLSDQRAILRAMRLRGSAGISSLLFILFMMVASASATTRTYTNSTGAGTDASTTTRTVSVAGTDFGPGASITKVTITSTFEKMDGGGGGSEPNTCTQVGGAGHQGGNVFNGEMSQVLQSAAGTNVNLFTAGTYTGNTYGNVVTVTFDSTLATLPSGTPVSGSFRPTGDLSTLVGQNPSGTWTLTIGDNTAQDPHCFNSYVLSITSSDSTAPNLSSFTSTTTTGSYGPGSTINITANYDESIAAGSTLTVVLNTGASVTLSTVSGNSISGTYTVGALGSGQNSSDLTVSSISSESVTNTSGVARTNSTVPASPNNIADTKDIVVDTTAPTVTNVTSSLANGSYKVGQVVPITITFSEAVTVTGTPQITLETGTTDAVVNYTSGTGTNTLTFNYTVAAGHTSSDLDYVDTSSLALNGGTIRDAVSNNAVLTLASPGAAGSIGANKAIVIDTTAPTVSSVNSTQADGSYTTGTVIPITVVFSEAVIVTGTPQITLETGAADAVVNYTSGSGTNTLTFNYTVAAGHTTADLDYRNTTALALNGGTIRDAATNNATLTLVAPGAAGSLGANRAIVIDTTAPTVSSVSATNANGTYGVGQVIAITVTFSEAVTVTGTPQLTLETGASDAVVDYSSGSGTNVLTFNYTIASGHTSADLDYRATTSLALNGGTIKDAATNNATLTLAAPGAANSLGANKAIVLDTVIPTITNVTSTLANGTYKAGQVIPIRITFSEAVTVTGTPQLTLETGTTDQVVNYTSGSGSTNLVFNYTVQTGDISSDLDYISTSALALNGGTIRDAGSNNATLTLAAPGAANSLGANKALVIDAVAPTVTNVTSSLADGSYKAGQVVPIQITFSENVTVVGTPQITLETGTTDAVVNYTSGSGTSVLTFNYTVAAGHTTADLDYVATNSLALNGGTIRDAATNDATLTLPSPGAAGSIGANKAIVIDTTAPTVTSVSSTQPNGSYGAGTVIPITVTFSENVTVSGTPQLTLETGTTDAVVNYTSGSGTNTLTFNYTVAAGHTSADLDYVATTSLALNGGTIRDTATNNATLTLAAPGAANSLGANKAIVIDTTAPTVTSVSSTTTNGTYGIGQVIAVTVTFSEAVVVSGTPQITLETGTTDAIVNYSSGSNSTTLTFNYTVAAGHTSADLDYISTAALALNSGTIRDAASNNATLTLASPGAANSLGANKNIVIDTTVPTVTNVTSGLANGTYTVGQVIPITVTFSKVVNVGGTPQLTLETGTTDAVVNYASGSGSNTLTFNYTVAAGHTSSDLDYVGTTSLALNGGTIRDAALNDANLTLAAPGAAGSLGANKALVIDTTAPTVTNITSSLGDGSYKAGQVVPITITFSEAVIVTGTPQLTLETGTTDAVVNYTSGSTTNTLTFTYTVVAGHTSADLDYVGIASLALNGGTMKDAATNDATLTLPTPGAAGSLGANKAIVIDTTAPTVTNVTSTQTDGSYTVGQLIPVTVTFSEAVTVTGTPQLTLETGTTDVVVNYTSGSGTNTLTFNYTVAAGNTSSDLDYVGTNSLALNSGSIVDAATNSATLTLPSPGAAGSLGFNKALVIDTTAPTVTNVTSSAADATYTVGAVIPVQVVFSEPVLVTGTPRLTLETGTTDAVVDYSSGSGTSTLVFNYTVAAGHTSADLDYVSTAALALNSGTIADAATNSAVLTLASPGAANSLGFNKAIVIDTTAPTVTNVTSSTANGSYKQGAVISVQVTFSESVTVSGTPQITLETGTSDAVVNYTSGSGSNTLVFSYTVAAGHTSADLDYVGTNSLSLNGGSIQDAGLNDAVLSLATPGAAGSLGANKDIVIDTTAPAEPVIAGVTTDTGASGSDGITSDTNLLVSGTAEASSIVEIFVNAVSAGTTTTDAFGNWTFDYTATTLANGTYSLTATATDAAGNVSATSSAFTLVVDSAAPAVPVVTSITTDSGSSSSDGVTNDTTLVFNGTAEANSRVEVFVDAVSVGFATTTPGGTWSFDHTGTALGNGTHSITATATDAAGNTSLASSVFTVVIDTNTPAPPVIVSIDTDTGASASDGITTDAALHFLGTAEANSLVEVFIDASSVGTVTTDALGNWDFDYTGTTLADGTYSVTATAQDAAGNTSATSAAFTVIVDNSPPAAPVVASITTDTGASSSDAVTSDHTLEFSGTAEAGSLVQVFVEGVAVGTTTASGGGAWTFDYTGSSLADGTYAVTAKSQDAAGNISGFAADLTVVIDSAAPSTPAVTSITTDTGASSTDGTTSDRTLNLAGTAEANSLVEIFRDAVSVGTVFADGTGHWNFDYTGTSLADGTYAFTATSTDEAGNLSSSSAAFTVVVDTAAPSAPLVSAVNSDTGSSSSDGVTSDNTLLVSGTAEANSVVEVLVDGLSVGTANSDGAGVWEFDYTGVSLADATYSITATATDAAGNASPSSAVFTLVVDSSAPAAPAVSAVTDDTGSSSSDGVTSDNALIVSGTAEPLSRVEVFFDGVSVGFANANGGGVWSFDRTGVSLADGSYAITARANDLAGNTSPLSAAFALSVDTAAPASPVVSSITTDSGAVDGHTSDRSLVFSGAAEAGTVVELFVDGSSVGTATADPFGAWTFDYTPFSFPDGTYAITATALDLAGNLSPLSASFSLVVDGTAPPAPTISGINADTGSSAVDGVTSDNTLLISGTSEFGTTVEVFRDGNSIGAVSVDPFGNWTLNYTGTVLPDGTYSFTAVATDLAANVSVSSAAFLVVVDTATPAAPVITAVQDDTGASASDGVTSDNTLSITGTAEAFGIVEVFLDGSSIGTVSADASGDWTFDYTATSLADATYSLTAKVKDAAGNESAASAGFTLVVDTLAPNAPAVLSVSTDTGTSSSDGITSDATLSISGSAEANSQVQVYVNAVSVGFATTNGAGVWSFDYTGTSLTDGTYSLRANAVDQAGNLSPFSSVFTLVIDSAAPSAPTISGVTVDSGASSSDGLTNDNRLEFSGTAEAFSSVEILIDGLSVGFASADVSGNWTFDYSSSVLSDGSYVLTATATDAAGNTSSPSVAFNLTVDTQTPSAPVVVQINTDTGAVDGVTSDTTLTVSGTAEPSSSVEVFVNAVSAGVVTTDPFGAWTFDYTGTVLADGTYQLTAVATDAAGNVSAASSNFTVVIDTAAPAAPSVDSVSNDSGTSSTDGVTNDQTLLFHGTAEANSFVAVSVNGNPEGTVQADAFGAWTFNYTGVSLADGTYSITAVSTDLSGNASAPSAAFTLVVDTASPAAPVVTGVNTDTGSSASDGITSDRQLVISGTAEPLSTVEISLNGGSVGFASADALGNWSFDYTGTSLADGTYSITVVARDAAGNASAPSAGFALVVDTAAPLPPSVLGVTDDSGVADGVTSDNTLEFSGSAEPGSQVEVFLNGLSIGSAAADGSGAWTFDYRGTSLADGSYVVTATATDAAGNTSGVSSDFALVIDTSTPAAPTVDSVSTDTGRSSSDGVTSDPTLVISGTAEANSSVEVFLNGTSLGFRPVNGAGNWTLDYTGTSLADGSYTLTALTYDLANNVSSVSADFDLVIDTAQPTPPVITDINSDTGSSSSDGVTSDKSLFVNGTAEANSSVEVFVNGVSQGSVLANGAGLWSFDYTGTVLADGTYVITATATDVAGNVSATSSTFTVVVDTLAPTAPTVDSIDLDTNLVDGTTSDNTLQFFGTAEANSSVEVFVDASSVGFANADAFGAWTFDYTGTTLADGTHAITATATDAAGNTSVLSTAFNATVDTSAPATPSILGINADTGASSTDGVTSDTSLLVSGSAEPGSQVEVFIDGLSVGFATTDLLGSWTFDYTGTSIGNGSYTITAQASDLAGNTSGVSSGFSLVVDTSAPAAPVIAGVTDDTGTSSSDGVTSDNTLVFSGTAEAGSEVRISLNAGLVGSAVADAFGNWTFDYTGTILSDGTYAVTATATDTAGNTSGVSSTFNLVVDTSTPSAPSVDTVSLDTGTSANDGMTSDHTLVISGSAELLSSVEVFLDGNSIGVVSADNAGHWSLDRTAFSLGDGTYSLTVTATDLSGNSTSSLAPYTLVIDSAAPASPVVTFVNTDTGSSSTDGVTRDNTLEFSGIAEANSTVEVFLNGSSLGTVAADGSGAWTFDHTGTTLADGNYALRATATDAAGNTSAPGAAFDLVVDTSAPAAPSVTGVTTDTGASNGDGVTSDRTLVFDGTAEPLSSVEVFVNAVSVGTVFADGFGVWHFDYQGTTLADGTYLLNAKATDSAGNTSALGGTFTVTVDTSSPVVPTVDSIDTDTGATDGVTSDNTLTFSGTAEANGSVEVFLDGLSIGSVLADAAGDWTFDYTGTTLADGTYSVTAETTDSAGNSSAPSAAFTVVVDTSAPVAPVVSSISTDTGASGTDEITSDTTLLISGSAEPDSVVEVFLNGLSIGFATTDGSGAWTYDHSAVSLASGTYLVTAVARDSSGNVSASSAALTVVIDTSAPVAPVVESVDVDSGAQDGITNDNRLNVFGSAEANSLVEVFVNGVSAGTVSTDALGDWTFDYTGTLLADGTYLLTAQSTDSAGNVSVLSSVFTLVVDTSAPSAPVISSISTDTGVADGVTSDNTLVFVGTAEANSVVEVFVNGVSRGTTTANALGDWTFNNTGTTLADGTYTLTATSSDAAGNTSAVSAGFTVVVDTATPAAPSVTSITLDSGASSTDGVTNDNRLEFSGTSEALSRVEVFLNGSSIGFANADALGAWTFDHTAVALGDGTYAVRAQATDSAGNISALGAAFTVIVDTSAPATPAVLAITTDTGSSATDGITSDRTLVVSGTAEANNSVEVFVDGVLRGVVAANGLGVWSFDYSATTLSDGSYAITSRATDAAGNVSSTSAVFTALIDTVAPSAPTVNSISTDTGATDGVTSDNTLSFSGTAEANSVVTVFVDGSSVGTATANGSGAWTFDYSATILADGSHLITATATDVAGNTSSQGAAFTAVVDTAAPTPPTVSSISTDTGSSASDQVTSDTTLVISGTAEANSLVTVFRNGVSIGSVFANGSGAWSFDYTAIVLSEGTYSLTAQSTDLSGNVSATGTALTVVIDTTAPNAPTVSAISTDTGSSSSDGVTSDTTLFISGTAEADSLVTVFVNGTSVGTANANAGGNWTFDYTVATLSEGTYLIRATATDAAGNTSVQGGIFTAVVDTSAPVAPVVSSISTDSGSSSSDQITNDQTLLISGTAEAFSSVQVFVDGNPVGVASADAAGNWSFDNSSNTLANGAHVITAQATDSAGNTSVFSGNLNVSIDTGAPSAPVVSSISNDTGNTDGVTSDTTLLFSGTAEANSTVDVFVDGVLRGSVTANGAGNWTFDYTGTTLAEGGYTITAQATDTAGNTSGLSADFDIFIDTSAPAGPSVNSVSTDTGSSASDGITSDATLLFNGTAEANSNVQVFVNGVSVGFATADSLGAWTFDHQGTTLADGTYLLTARATDLAGNTSTVGAVFTLTVDTTAPALPLVLSVSTDTGASSTDAITSDNTLSFSGTAEANSRVQVIVDGTAVGFATTTGAGTWTFDYSAVVLSDGPHTIRGAATDAAGNTSSPSPVFTVVVDTSAPAAPTVSSVTSDTGSSSSDGVTSDNTLFINGTAEANSTVQVFVNGVSAGFATADGSGAWTFNNTATTLGDGTYAITAVANDTAGNSGPTSSAFTVTVDTGAPTAPSITAPVPGSSVSDTTPTFSGTAEPGSVVTVREGSTVLCSATANISGAWSCTSSVLSEGAHTVSATAVDPAGNSSSPSAPDAFTVDTTAPSAPAITSPTSGTSTSDTTPSFSGTAEPNSTVTVSDGSLGQLCQALADGAGSWTCTSTVSLADGTYSVTATATDSAGNTSGPSSAVSLTVDTAAPTAPTITSPSNGSATSDSTPTFSGTGEPNSTITVTDGAAGTLCTAIVDSFGAWTCTSSVSLSDGAHSITATSTDSAGNTSAPSTPLSLTVDTTAPTAPTISSPIGGSSTNDSTPTFSGTAEPNSTVTVTDTVAGMLCTATTDSLGNWSCSSTVTLADGSHSVSATATDAVGNTSAPSSSVSFTVDTVAPSAPVISSPASGSSTNDSTPSFAGTAEANSTVVVSDSVLGVLCTTTADALGNWSCSSTVTLTDGTRTITARATDSSGNTSVPSAPLSLVIDTAAPSAPVITSPVNGSFTNDSTPTISGTAEANSTIVVKEGSTTLCTTTTNGSGAWTCVSSVLSNGLHAITARATDVAGNTGPASAVDSFTVDTVAPGSPVITAPTEGATTESARPTISGTGEPGSVITIYDGTSVLGVTTVDGSGNWTFVPSNPMSNGPHTVTATATDAAGNTSAASGAVHFNVDSGVANFVTSPAFVKWNTYLSQWNFLELIASGPSGFNVTIDVYNLRSQRMISETIFLGSNAEYDYDVNDAIRRACATLNPGSCTGLTDVDGDGMIDSYGTIVITFNPPQGTHLVGRLTNYRPDAGQSSFSFAFPRELRPTVRGKTYAVANTYDPQDQGFLVPNWGELIHIGDAQVVSAGGNVPGGRYTINIYNQTGTLMQSQRVPADPSQTLPALAETDFAAGHQLLDPVTHAVIQSVYLIEVVPDDLNAEYLFSVARYSSNSPATQVATSYNYAMASPGRSADTDTIYAPITNESFACGTVINWVEVANVSNSPQTADIRFRDSSGALVGVVSSPNNVFPAKGQLHFNGSALLLTGDIGSVEIEPSVPGTFIAQSMTYVHSCSENKVDSAYVSLGRPTGRQVQLGTINTFLGMTDKLRSISTVGSPTVLNMTFSPFGGSTILSSRNLPALGADDLPVNGPNGLNFPVNEYGSVQVDAGGSQRFLSEVLRSRNETRNGRQHVDFIVPTEVR